MEFEESFFEDILKKKEKRVIVNQLSYVPKLCTPGVSFCYMFIINKMYV